MLELDTTVSFATFNDAALNTTFENVFVLSRLNYEDATLMSGVDARHAIMWPFVEDKARYSNDPKSYAYYSLRLPNGGRAIVGEAWINPTTITTVSQINKTALLTFANAEQKTRFETLMRENRLTYAYKV